MLCLRAHREFSNKKFLIMDFMEGAEIDDYADDASVDARGKSKLAKILANNYMKQIFTDGFFHADPHPGNILLKESNEGPQITYLDFGMVGKLNHASIRHLNELLVAIASGKPEEIRRNLLLICRKRGKVNEDKLLADITRVFDQYYGMSASDGGASNIFGEIVTLCTNNNLVMPRELTLVFKGLLTIEGIISKLDPTASIQKLIKPYVEKYLFSQFDLLGEIKKYIDSLAAAGTAIPRIPVQISELIEQTKQGDLKVTFDHKGLDHVADQLESSINRLTMGLVVAAIIIGSAFLVRFNAGLVGIVASNLGAFGFIIAIMIGVSMLWSSIRKRKGKSAEK